MPEFRKTCDIVQAFDGTGDEHNPVGAITSLTLGRTTLVPDLSIPDPILRPAGRMTSVGPLSAVSWGLGSAMPVAFSGVFAVRNQQLVLSYLSAPATDLKVTVGWTVFDFDELTGDYFACFSTSPSATSTSGIPAKLRTVSPAGVRLTVGSVPITDIAAPKLYPFTLEIVPATQRLLYLATSTTDKVAKNWG